MSTRTRARTPRLELRVFRVEVVAHTIARWDIPASTGKLPAADAAHACEIVVGRVQRAAGVPPWRPYRRASSSFAHATAIKGHA